MESIAVFCDTKSRKTVVLYITNVTFQATMDLVMSHCHTCVFLVCSIQRKEKGTDYRSSGWIVFVFVDS